jgi:hypothetical protein
MAYFPNMTSWEMWAADNCFRCAHWPKHKTASPCPVEMAHNLYSYELCNDKEHPGKVILDMLIPPTKDGCGAQKCAMFRPENGVSDKHLKDWAKYKAVMAEMEARP